MPYSPALDGLRAVAIALVVLFHARAPVGLGGFVGVDIFFVLSGFLITSLLLSEQDAKGTVDLPRFYWRRVLRLTPALLAMLAIYVAVAPLAWPRISDHGTQAALAAVYLSDYSVALFGVPTILSHTWSLSVEAHFYLLWPLAIVATMRRWNRRALVIGLGVVYLAATLWRLACILDGQSWNQVYYRFDTHLTGLVLGSWLAAVRRDPAVSAGLDRFMPSLLWWLPVLALACMGFGWGNMEVAAWGFSVVEWGTLAVLVAIQRPDSKVGTALSQRSLVWLGKMSYGIYLWHYPVFRFLRLVLPWEWVLVVGLPLSVALAALSFYSVESWARRRRRSAHDVGLKPSDA